MPSYIYPNITQDNYGIPGFYHTVQNKDGLINIGYICNINNGSFTYAYLMLSIDNEVSWLTFGNIVTNGTVPPTLGGWNLPAIDGIMIIPPANTTFTLIISEFYDHSTVRKLGS